MADRLAALGGELDIRSAPGTGTTVTGRLPFPAADHNLEVPPSGERLSHGRA
jgi:signal transduction histidine kinase